MKINKMSTDCSIIMTLHEMAVLYNLNCTKKRTYNIALLPDEKKQLSDFLQIEILECFFSMYKKHLFYFRNDTPGFSNWHIAKQETQMDALLGHFNEN